MVFQKEMSLQENLSYATFSDLSFGNELKGKVYANLLSQCRYHSSRFKKHDDLIQK